MTMRILVTVLLIAAVEALSHKALNSTSLANHHVLSQSGLGGASDRLGLPPTHRRIEPELKPSFRKGVLDKEKHVERAQTKTGEMPVIATSAAAHEKRKNENGTWVHGSTLTGTAKHAVCNVTLPGYNDDRCLEQTIGRSRTELQDEYRQSVATVNSALARQHLSCSKSVYTWSFEEFEKLYPELRHCYIGTYAMLVEAEALRFPCRSPYPGSADILMVPPYLGLDCNWPAYGGGNCFQPANQYRHGTKCTTEVISVVAKLQASIPGKPVLLVEVSPYWEPYFLPAHDYAVPGRIFAKSNTLTNFYRPNTDISFPPPPFPRCRDTPPQAYDEPLSAKQWFVSFKGNFGTHKIRPRVAQLFHNGIDQIIVPSTNVMYDFDALLHKSRFNLILRGDVQFSYRFNEAVCSGGVPVLVTDSWVPPFNEIIPFQSYGVLVHEKDLLSLMEILRGIPDARVEAMRKVARVSCQNAFKSLETTTKLLLHHLVGQN